VEIPKHLTAAQRQALEQFSKLCDESTHPEGQSFLEKARKLFKG
jgi:DnaJ-class molecular chaperone